jgi:hypothetical protein
MMAGTSTKTKALAMRIPLNLLAAIDARGPHGEVMLAALVASLGGTSHSRDESERRACPHAREAPVEEELSLEEELAKLGGCEL